MKIEVDLDKLKKIFGYFEEEYCPTCCPKYEEDCNKYNCREVWINWLME